MLHPLFQYDRFQFQLKTGLFPDNLLPMGLATAVGSLLSVLICLTAYLLLKRKGTFGGKAA